MKQEEYEEIKKRIENENEIIKEVIGVYLKNISKNLDDIFSELLRLSIFEKKLDSISDYDKNIIMSCLEDMNLNIIISKKNFENFDNIVSFLIGMYMKEVEKIFIEKFGEKLIVR